MGQHKQGISSHVGQLESGEQEYGSRISNGNAVSKMIKKEENKHKRGQESCGLKTLPPADSDSLEIRCGLATHIQ